ncbi:GntR family transcriptional regulator [Aquisediminimonas sediminicola]|uniref:GntR family transcriptional regulator n=1 Tax=Alteraquisediminimonas sediminicola TaxID=2676787 RepID=UPI001C8E5C75|nr:GntR family transcriptional regulator [Aquisediminimonas sediminicola]
MSVVDQDPGPMHLRLRGLIVTMLLDGSLQEGDQLPSVRAFAASHNINPLTVAKAYQHFQDLGHIVARRGVGMFIAKGAIEKLRREERAFASDYIAPRLRHMLKLIGMSHQEFLAELDSDSVAKPCAEKPFSDC